MGLLLFIVAAALSVILYPVGLLTSLFMSFRKARFKAGLKRFNLQLLSIATSIDMNGNVVLSDLLNLIWRKADGHKFGRRKETISSALGKNQLTHTLTWFGWLIAGLLNLIDKNHCINSIDQNV